MAWPAMSECNELIFIVEEAPEGGYTARALGEAIFTEADDLTQLRAQLRDAVQCHYGESAMTKVTPRRSSAIASLRPCPSF